MMDGTCTHDGCTRPVAITKWRLCRRHYQRARNRGVIDTTGRVPRHSIVVSGGVAACSTCGPSQRVIVRGGILACGRSALAALSMVKRGISPEQVIDVLAAAGGVCMICSEPLTVDTLRLDHDHRCCGPRRACLRCIRGPLCHNCNVGLGHFRDDPDLLRSAVDYLIRKNLSLTTDREFRKNLPIT